MTDIGETARQVSAAAARDEAALFDQQYQLDRQAERAVATLVEQGRARARQWADDDRRDEADRRFDPEPDDAEERAAATARGAPAPVRAAARPVEVEEEDDDDPPTRWLH